MMISTQKKYNKKCLLEVCNNWRREDGFFCLACYKSLPDYMRSPLWSDNTEKVTAGFKIAKQFLEDRWNASRIVQED